MSRRHLYLLSATLTALGLGMFAYKWLVLDFPLVPDRLSELWRVDVKVTFIARGGPARVTIQIPQNEAGHTIVDQTFIANGFGLTTAPRGANRQADFAIRRASGEQTLYYRSVVLKTKDEEEGPKLETPSLPKVRLQGLELAAARSLARALQEQSADEESLVTLLLQQLRTPEKGRELALLLGNRNGGARQVQVAVALLSLSGIPARAVHGVSLGANQRRAAIVHWLEIFRDGRWQAFDPADGRAEVPRDAIAWWRGGAPLVKLEGGDNLRSDVSVSRAFEVALTAALAQGRERDSAAVAFSVFSLPLQTRAVYQLLMTVPVGILILVVLRNMVGVKTFGTFMPVLIALAFRQTELIWGLALFAMILVAGLSVRFYLERLKLLLVPRLAAIVIVVILLMAVFSVFAYKIGFDRGLSVALFPIVILAMTIERMSIVWDERGPAEAFLQAGGSLFVAIICYLAMNMALVQHLSFVFPELLLVVLALVLLLGRYSGYRLTELFRFKVLAKDA